MEIEHNVSRQNGLLIPQPCLRSTNKILAGLSSEEMARIYPYLESVTVSVGEDLAGFDGKYRFAYFPETSVFAHLHILSDGNTSESAMIGSEGMAGISALFNSEKPLYWIQVLLAGKTLRIRTELLKVELQRGSALLNGLLGFANTLMEQVSQRAVCAGRHKVDERFCSWILMLDDRARRRPFRLTQERMAAHLGVRRAGITGVATRLRDGGIIAYRRGLVHIEDRVGLEALCCECYRTLKHPLEKRTPWVAVA